jgi:hypothetical protein
MILACSSPGVNLTKSDSWPSSERMKQSRAHMWRLLKKDFENRIHGLKLSQNPKRDYTHAAIDPEAWNLSIVLYKRSIQVSTLPALCLVSGCWIPYSYFLCSDQKSQGLDYTRFDRTDYSKLRAVIA